MTRKLHELKTLPKFFNLVCSDTKNFEVRKDDRDFKEGDKLILKEFDGEKYTGRTAIRTIGYILDDIEYCKEGYVILGFKFY